MAEKKFKDFEVAKPFAEVGVLLLAAIIVVPLLAMLFSWVWNSGVPEVLSAVLFRIKIITTIIAMAAIVVAVYSFTRLHEIEKEEREKLGLTLTWEHGRIEKNHRWERIEEGMRSENPSDWKVAILDADNILDEVVLRMGYHGETLGERMKAIESSDFPYLDDAWQAHKTRNDIAHQGDTEYVLTRPVAERTIDIYYRVFKELGYL